MDWPPNRVSIPAQAWVTVETTSPAILWPLTTPAGIFYVAAESELADPTATRAGKPYTYAPVFHGAGRWRVYYDVAAGIECLLIHAKDASLGPLIGSRAGGVSADVRNADADADFASAILGATANVRLSALDIGSAEWARLAASSYAGAADIAPSLRESLFTIAQLIGRDSAAALMRTIEARAMTSWEGAALTFPVMGTASHLMTQEAGAVVQRKVAGVGETTGGIHALGSLQMRASGYWGGLRDRRFTLCLPQGAIIDFAAAFSATSPQLLFVPPATNEWIIRRLTLIGAGNALPTNARIRIVADPDNRFSAGGTSMTPTGGFRSTNRGGAGTLTPTQALYDDGVTAITATAADNNELHYGDFSPFSSSVGTHVMEFDDGLIIPPSGSLLIYLWSALGTEDITFQLDLESANIQ